VNQCGTGGSAASAGREVVAACALACVPGIGPATLLRIASSFGSLEDALLAGSPALSSRAAELRLTGPALRFLEQQPDLERLGRWAVRAAREAGAKILLRSDPAYPRLLGGLESAPAVLYVRGELACEARRVAIVGARAADDGALRLARSLGEELAAAGVEIVSGGARGVDAAAHAGALWGGGKTVAVLGTGVDVPYPAEHAPLFDRIASAGGALVSELPPGTPSARKNFPRRNRIIAALSHATVVVRATTDSGAMITANYALEEGRALFAVPGDPADELSAGPNYLIAEGAARAVRSTVELLELLDWSMSEQASAHPIDRRPTATTPARMAPEPAVEEALDGPSRDLWVALDERRPVHVDVLADRARVPTHEALRCLMELELKGLCRQRPGKYFLRQRLWSVNPNGSAGI
jgi:DNA processing protein